MIAGLVLALLLLSGGCGRQGDRGDTGGMLPAGLAARSPGGSLQEVAPPGAVAQFNAALGDRHPQVAITAPSEGAVLPAGPWQLELTVTDWPLVDAGTLGLGPHLVVQVDDAPPRRISDWQNGDPDSGRLGITLPELSPGSHRLLVYAARPWGEAVKRPGAVAQLRVHRVSANPLSQPPPASPLLWPTSPAGLAEAEPVLVDWLLQDAPLQGLREGDARWRLRITVNGDSFLVDQNTPVWLRGLRRGSNAVLLELLDGQGEPLNPPFNSAVREVRIDAAGPRPLWLAARLNADALARLLGEEPAPQDTAEKSAKVDAEDSTEADAGTGASIDRASGPGATVPIDTETATDSESETSSDGATATATDTAMETDAATEAPATGDPAPADRSAAGEGEPAMVEPAMGDGDGAPGPEADTNASGTDASGTDARGTDATDTDAPAAATGEVQP